MENQEFVITRGQWKVLKEVARKSGWIRSQFVGNPVKCALDDEEVLERAEENARLAAFPELFEAISLLSTRTPGLFSEFADDWVLLHDLNSEEWEALWTKELEPRGYQRPEWKEEDGGLLLWPWTPTPSVPERQQALDELLRGDSDFVRIDLSGDMAFGRNGICINARALANAFGISRYGIFAIEERCDSLAVHLMHSMTCGENDEMNAKDLKASAAMADWWSKAKLSDLDCVLARVLGAFHYRRDDIAAGYPRANLDGLVIQSGATRWAYIDDKWLAPALSRRSRTHEAIYSKLAALASLEPLGASRDARRPSETLLAEVVDARNIPTESEVARGARSRGLGLDRVAGDGFYVRLGRHLNRLGIPYVIGPGGSRTWGPAAITSLTRKKGSEEADTTMKRWAATGGYFWYPECLADPKKFTAVERLGIAGCLDSVSYTSPKWRSESGVYKDEDLKVWVQKSPGDSHGLSGIFRPLHGIAYQRVTAEAWTEALGLTSGSVSKAGERRELVTLLETLVMEFGVRLQVRDFNQKSALAMLRWVAGKRNQWLKLPLKLYLPMEFEARILMRSSVRSEPTRGSHRQASNWSGERIEQSIQRYGLKQKDLAEAVGVSPAMVSQWISGVKPVSATRASTLDEVFDRYEEARTRVMEEINDAA